MVTLRVENADIADLFVWLWDLNTADQNEVLSGVRINEGKYQDNVQLQADGDGKAACKWTAQRADNQTVSKTGDANDLVNDDRVDVSAA